MDPTSLTQLLNRYKIISENLLNSSDLSHQHDSSLLQDFKDIYRTPIYPCRYQCKGAVNDFVSIEERDQHESFYHIKVYRCGDMSCDLSVRGFSTKAALKTHTKLYHSKVTDEPAPILRRKRAMQLKKAALEKEDFEGASNDLIELDLESLPGYQKPVESDWFAIFNPKVPRVLDVELVHSLQHLSVVCCVSFSYCGKYMATGCNRTTQVFDVVTGQELYNLKDDSADLGDNYIRSVCFSPDGRCLATGAEDKFVRVGNDVDFYMQ
jgi:hypothetical protein